MTVIIFHLNCIYIADNENEYKTFYFIHKKLEQKVESPSFQTYDMNR